MSANENLSTLLSGTLTRRDLGKYAAAAAALAGFIPGEALAHAAALQETGRGGTLVIARAGDANTLDPQKTILGLSLEVLYCVYDTLTVLNYDNEIEGVLAESWDISEDEMEYTFHLREGINFHDGTPFTADAVKAAFDRVLDPATNTPTSSWVSALKETVVIDPATVKMVLSEPFSPLLANLASGYFSIPSPTAVEEMGDDYGVNPVGTGSWKFKEWVQGESITLEPNPDYHNVRSYVVNKGGPLLDQVIFRTMPEAQTILAAFETGEVNVISPPPREVARIQADPAYTMYIAPRGNDLWYLDFAMVQPPAGEFGAIFKPPFDDLRLRQAVNYGINIDGMIENIMEGYAVRNYGPMPTGMFPYKPEIKEFGYGYDQEKAKALLEEAGWVDADGDGIREKDGKALDILLWSNTNPVFERIGQVIQNELGLIGFNVKLEVLESGTKLARLPENIHDLNIAGWGQTDPDMVRGMTNGTWGLGRYRDEQYQTLVSQALKTTDRAERTELYFEAGKKIMADAALVPLWTNLALVATRADVVGYQIVPFFFGMGVLEDVYISE